MTQQQQYDESKYDNNKIKKKKEKKEKCIMVVYWNIYLFYTCLFVFFGSLIPKAEVI